MLLWRLDVAGVNDNVNAVTGSDDNDNVNNNDDDDCFDRFLTYFLNSRNWEDKKEKEKMLECSRRFGSPFS